MKLAKKFRKFGYTKSTFYITLVILIAVLVMVSPYISSVGQYVKEIAPIPKPILMIEPAYAAGTSGAIINKTHAGDTWTQQTSGTTNQINSVDFINSNTGWAVGGTGGVSGKGIYKTTDGGDTWVEQDSGIDFGLNSVDFIDSDTGYAVGDFSNVIKTTNGGSTWIDVDTLATTTNYYSVDFIGSNMGWIAGEDGIIRKTTDGGDTWTSQTIGTNDLRSIDFIDSDKGWVVGDSGTIFNTIDGDTWTSQTSGTTKDLRSVDFINSYMGWAVGYEIILKTTDGGVTWVEQDSGHYVYSVSFIDYNTGWASGHAGLVLHTEDGGDTWIEQPSVTNQNLNSVDAIMGPDEGIESLLYCGDDVCVEFPEGDETCLSCPADCGECPNCYDNDGVNYYVASYTSVGGVKHYDYCDVITDVLFERTCDALGNLKTIEYPCETGACLDGCCWRFCGDGLCNVGETCNSCPSDCGDCCGNGVCDSQFGETCDSCEIDCGECYCGDGVCNGAETCETCEQDCGICSCTGTITYDCPDNNCKVIHPPGGANPDETYTCDGTSLCDEVCKVTNWNACNNMGENCCTPDPAAECIDITDAEICTGAGCDVAVPVCGDGECTEECAACPADCSPCCGDGTCSGAETCDTCELDCGVCCGDGACDSQFGEDCETCETDCGVCSCTGTITYDCPDNNCKVIHPPGGANPDETYTCDGTSLCDEVCKITTWYDCATGENCCTPDPAAECIDITDAEICVYAGCNATVPVCGDGECNGDETAQTCSVDCPPVCGDTYCDSTRGETCDSCETDCGVCCGNDVCEPQFGEDCETCETDCGICPPVCSDGSCNGNENCSSCETDCGPCCIDSDGGIDYYVKGCVEYGLYEDKQTKCDYCTSSTSLIEYFCSGDTMAQSSVAGPLCEDGALILDQEESEAEPSKGVLAKILNLFRNLFRGQATGNFLLNIFR